MKPKQRISEAEKRARANFRKQVLAKGDCAMRRPGEQCEGDCDPHHVLKEQFLRSETLSLSEPEALAIRFDPRIGVPLCRRHHDRVTAASQRPKLHQLPVEVFEFVADHGWQWRLELELNGKPSLARSVP